MTEREKVNRSSINKLKKDYLLWSNSTKVIYTLGQFEILQEYENKIGKEVWDFTESEYLLFFKDKVPSGARINLNQQIKNYIRFADILGIGNRNCYAANATLNEILRNISNNDERWITAREFENIMSIVYNSSLDPVYDRALILLYYLGIGARKIVDLETTHIIDSVIEIDNLHIEITNEEKSLLYEASYLTSFHALRNLEFLLLQNKPKRVIKLDKIYENKRYEAQAYTHRVNTRIKKIILNSDQALGAKFSGVNLKFSGLFNKMFESCMQDGLDIVNDFTISNSFPNITQYEQVLRRYSTMNVREFKMKYSGILQSIKKEG